MIAHEKDSALPGYVRGLSIAVTAILSGMILIEMWITLHFWFNGVAYPAIVESFIQQMPELWDYAIAEHGMTVYLTFLLDVGFMLPYYAVLFLTGILFYRFYQGRVWRQANMALIQTIGTLVIVDVMLPPLHKLLQILVFTMSGKPVLSLSVGVQSGQLRMLVIGCAILVLGRVMREALAVYEEQRLIV